MSDSHTQAVLGVSYGIFYNAANENFFRHLKFIFEGVSVVAGGGAFAAWLVDKPSLAAGSGLFLAVLAAINLLISPGETAARFNEAYRLFTGLSARARKMTVEDIDAEIAVIRAGAPWGIDALGGVAFNRCLISNGYANGLLPISRWERFVSFFA